VDIMLSIQSKRYIRLLLIACFTAGLFFCTPSYLKSQTAADTALLSLQKKNAIDLYYQSLQTQSGLYNGSEYVPYETSLKEGHPYFDTTKMLNGSVFYNGMLYKDVPMLYDIIRDELIIQHYNKVFYLQLIKSKVDSFNLMSHAFVHMGRDSSRKDNLKEGFYDLLHDGKTKLYIRRYKDIQESIPDFTVEKRVYAHTRYFIYKNNVYNEVYSQASVLDVLSDKKMVLKQELRKQHIKFKKQREYAIKTMVEQYDALNP
jgi:hypothetical protein